MSTDRRRLEPLPVGHPKYCLIGLAVASGWTIVGFCLALVHKSGRQFLDLWYSLQGLFLIWLGTWLLLVVRSGSLKRRVLAITRNPDSHHVGIVSRSLRIAVVVSISLAGTVSLIAMGFDAKGSLLVFLWLTCFIVCLTAAFVTLHALSIVWSVVGLQEAGLRVFRYSPAQTPELRSLVSYFSSFTFLMTLGYACALAATLSPHWTGNKDYVAAVRIFWPLLYVPACSIVLIYPHVIVHRLVQREKEQTLILYQQEMDQLLQKYGSLNSSDIERTNALAQMFDRISATPDYVVDLGIAVRTALPLAFNLASLFAKALVSHS
jgi:hypothetical protein